MASTTPCSRAGVTPAAVAARTGPLVGKKFGLTGGLATMTRLEAHNEPGGSCPLCRFPTFQWAGADVLTPAAEEAVRQHFPQWTRVRGCCARCAELYAMKPLEQPATLYV